MKNKPIYKFAIREDLKDSGINFLPERATPRSTGWDVKAAFPDRKSITLHCGSCAKIPLGFRTFCPEDWWFELKPRSSSFAKKQLHCLYGTIDEDYEGQLILAVQYLPDHIGVIDNLFSPALTIEFGEPLGQIIPVKRVEMGVEEITNSNYDELCLNRNAKRGAGGFGSSDKK